MEQNLKISYMKPDKQGVFTNGNGYLFATETESDKECGVVLYSSCGKELRIPFSAEGKQGTLSGLCIECTNETFPFTKYNYYQGDSIYTDPYARLIDGLQLWGDFENAPRKTYGILTDMNFDWENDTAPDIPLQESVIYGLNVRAFTMHKSSFVKCKGTFEGIVEKIPHLQKLGITAVELMPAYEYEECMPSEASVQTKADRDMRVNCWGFQKGFYFSPKSSYSLQRADISFKSMVKALHRNGIEIWMHFYFLIKVSHIIDNSK